MADQTILLCEQLNQIYPNGVHALVDVNLSISEGEYVAFVGQNGSGKTTLVKHFNGLLKPSQGKVKVFGEDTREKKVSYLSRKVGYVFQNPDDMLFCNSVEDEIAYGPRMLHYEQSKIDNKVKSILKELDLEHLHDIHPFALSLGDRQRLAVACALSLDPDVFIFDEPTTGQDYFGGKSIMTLIDQLQAKGKTIIIISHDMPLVAEHARRVVVINKGQIAMDGTPEQIFSNTEKLRQLSLRSPQVTLLAQELGLVDRTLLRVPQIVEWLEEEYLPSQKPLRGGQA